MVCFFTFATVWLSTLAAWILLVRRVAAVSLMNLVGSVVSHLRFENPVKATVGQRALRRLVCASSLRAIF